MAQPWKGIIGKNFTTDEFAAYCNSLQWTTWRPTFVVLHNTAIPNLAQRPNGLTQQQILNLQTYYRDKQQWSSGPHLFIDDLQIWVFTPLTTPGTHSPSWNNVSLGIEMLGDYTTDAFDSGRGLAVHKNAVSAIATLSSVLGLNPDTLHLHKEDPKTTHKTCPGKNVIKDTLIADIKTALDNIHPGDHPPTTIA